MGATNRKLESPKNNRQLSRSMSKLSISRDSSSSSCETSQSSSQSPREYRVLLYAANDYRNLYPGIDFRKTICDGLDPDYCDNIHIFHTELFDTENLKDAIGPSEWIFELLSRKKGEDDYAYCKRLKKDIEPDKIIYCLVEKWEAGQDFRIFELWESSKLRVDTYVHGVMNKRNSVYKLSSLLGTPGSPRAVQDARQVYN